MSRRAPGAAALIVERAYDSINQSLIHWAAMLNCSKLLRFLLSKDVPVDSLDLNKRTPLSWAADYHALQAVEILSNHGAEINSMDYRYYTPLRYAVFSDAIAVDWI